MKFNTKDDAWEHWTALYDFHGEDLPGDNEVETMDMFDAWAQDTNVSWLDEDVLEFLAEEQKHWEGNF